MLQEPPCPPVFCCKPRIGTCPDPSGSGPFSFLSKELPAPSALILQCPLTSCLAVMAGSRGLLIRGELMETPEKSTGLRVPWPWPQLPALSIEDPLAALVQVPGFRQGFLLLQSLP